MVIALHGCSQNGENLSEHSGWSKLAEENDFIVLFPEQKRTNNVSNCFNWFNLDDITANSGEVKSIITMIDFAIKNYNIDTSRIYIYGVSAGAAMAVCLLANYPEYFNAGAILAGAPYKTAINATQAGKAIRKPVDKSPEEWARLVTTDSIKKQYPKLIVCHGNIDNIVNIKNSYELIEQWSYLHEMDTIPDAIANNYKSKDMNRAIYKNKSGEEMIVFYTFLGIGHTIPVDPGTDKTQGGKEGIFAKDTDYFSTYYIAMDFNLIIK